MKQIRTLTLIAACGIVLLSSCSKDKTSPNPVPEPAPVANEKLIVATNEFGWGSVITYYPDKKIKSYSYNDGSVRSAEFTYNGNTATKRTYKNGVLNGETEYTLNEKGLMKTSHFKAFNSNGVVTFESDAVFIYNAAGQLIKETYSDGDYADRVYDADGNVSEYHYYENGAEVWRSTYTYYTDKKRKRMSYGYGNSNGDGGMIPLFSKNLLKHQKSWDMTTQTLDFDGEYTYELDSEGFITKGQYTNALTGFTWQWTHTYQ